MTQPEYRPYVTHLNPVEAVKLLNELPPVGDSGVHVGLELRPQDNQSIQLRLYDESDESVGVAILDCYPMGPIFWSTLRLEVHDRDMLGVAMQWFKAAKCALPAAAAEQEPEPWWWDDVQDPKHRRFIELWLKTKGDVPAMAESLGMSEYRVRRTSSTLRKRYGERVVPLKRRF